MTRTCFKCGKEQNPNDRQAHKLRLFPVEQIVPVMIWCDECAEEGGNQNREAYFLELESKKKVPDLMAALRASLEPAVTSLEFIPDEAVQAAAEAANDEAITRLGRDLGTLGAEHVMAAGLAAALPHIEPLIRADERRKTLRKAAQTVRAFDTAGLDWQASPPVVIAYAGDSLDWLADNEEATDANK